MAIDQVLLFTREDGVECGAIEIDPINSELVKDFVSHDSRFEGLKMGLWVVRDPQGEVLVYTPEGFDKAFPPAVEGKAL